jgi:Family of unknown function (DUF6314)
LHSVKTEILSITWTNSGFIAGDLFRALHNSTWVFERVVIGKPCEGTVQGRAQFLFSHPHELLYQEQGKLTLTSWTSLDTHQKYLYRYDEENDLLSVNFIGENHRSAALFHTLYFQPNSSSRAAWLANGEHVCGQDDYFTSYLFTVNRVNLLRWQITYRVKVPVKDYLSQTLFQPVISHNLTDTSIEERSV